MPHAIKSLAERFPKVCKELILKSLELEDKTCTDAQTKMKHEIKVPEAELESIKHPLETLAKMEEYSG